MTATKAQLLNELQKVKSRIRKRNAKTYIDNERIDAICVSLYRLAFVELIDIPGAVKHRDNGVKGTVISVRTAQATIDFGQHGKLIVPLSDLRPANDDDFRSLREMRDL